MKTILRVLCSSIFLFLPTYLIRFSIGSIPSTVLEVLVLIFFGVSLWHYLKTNTSPFPLLRNVRTNSPLLFWGTILFLSGATISIFTAVDVRAAAGAWKAFFIEPVLLAIILIDLGRKKLIDPYTHIAVPLVVCASATALYALYQYIHPELIPAGFFVNTNTFRTTAWYGFPNGVGIFLGATIALIWTTNALPIKQKVYRRIGQVMLSLLFIIAIYSAKSTGAVVGIAGILGLSLLMHTRTRTISIGIGILLGLLLLLLPASNPIRTELFAQDRSGQIRRAIWSETIALLKDRPIFGAGLESYDERIAPYHTAVNGEGIEIFHHPHNLLLTMWVNTGVVGLTGFLLIIIGAFIHAVTLFRKRGYHESYRHAFQALVAILIMGLVDSPYIKNDWAIVFWAVIAMVFIVVPHTLAGKTKQ